jgi:hypothetical protein
MSIFDPFLPENLDKLYVKFKSKKSDIIQISDELDGVLNYFTAYSIRHKVNLFKFKIN